MIILKKKYILFDIFVFIASIFECIYFSIREIANDTFYSIKIGEYISKHGIDFKDHYSFIDNLSYSYPHWLYDLFIYKVHNLFGFDGLHILNIIFSIILFMLLYFIAKKITNSRLLSFLFSSLCAKNLIFFMVTRAQQVTIILFILFLLCLHKFIIENKKIYGLFCFIISVLIANLHCAVWPFLFVLLLPFIAESVILKLKDKSRKKLDIFENKFIFSKEINNKYLLIAIIICFISGIFTPLHFEPYTYLIKTMLGNSQEYIKEHQPIELINYPFQFMFLVFTFVLLFLKSKFKFRELFMIFGLFYLSLNADRHSLFLITIGGLYCLIVLSRIIKSIDSNTLNIIDNKIFKIYILVPILCLIAFVTINDYRTSNEKMLPKAVYPVDSVNWIKANLDYENIKIYNDYEVGSYLIYNGIKVFVDTRADLYTPEFNRGCYVLDDSYGMKYSLLQEKYNFTHFLVKNNTDKYNYLVLDDNFEEIYSDKYFTIFNVKQS